MQPGDAIRLVDGKGRVGTGELVSQGKNQLTVSIERVVELPRPMTLDLIVPVADKERMLWAAEKCAELQITSWRPVYFARSRSVTPRGEGPKFCEKVTARMESALEQSGAAWMPDIHEESDAADTMKSVPREWKRLLLDAAGDPLAGLVANGPTALAVGPEGGLERPEVIAAQESGWVSASLAATTLRFETAVVAGVAVIRATQLSHWSS
jgi:16S rRNA (uracil1498-N3)-methyltransferase